MEKKMFTELNIASGQKLQKINWWRGGGILKPGEHTEINLHNGYKYKFKFDYNLFSFKQIITCRIF